jgi:hypothetical protein
MKAFPSTEPIYRDNVIGMKQSNGMDLRDYFAIQFATNQLRLIVEGRGFDALETFKTSYKLADIMMKARDK